MTRYYRLDHTDGGPLPEHPWLKVGAIIKVARTNSSKPGAVFNKETHNWVSPRWVECDDPTVGAA